MASGASIEVVLRSADTQDTLQERRFTLRPTEQMPIGRASKNSLKPNLMMAANNAFIDSPVVSREHASLSADTTAGTMTVHIVDNSSMHGTSINGNKLEPNRATRLNNGDVLQFGADVSRNDSFFTARKYVFESTVLNDFPKGFSVPEGETSEEEDIGEEDEDLDELVMTSVPRVPRYGSQSNPVNVDDFEDSQPAAVREVIAIDLDDGIDREDAKKTVRAGLAAAGEEAKEQTSVPLFDILNRPPSSKDYEEHEEHEELAQASDDEEAAPSQSHLQDILDAADSQSFYSSEYEVESAADGSSMSLADNETDSEREGPSDIEGFSYFDDDHDEPENEDETTEQAEAEKLGQPVEVVRNMKMTAMLNDGAEESQKHGKLSDSPFAPRPTAPIGVPQLIASATAPSPRRDDPYPTFAGSAQAASSAALKAPELRAPALDSFAQSLGVFGETYNNNLFGGHMGSSLPPRPAAPKPGPWGVSMYSNSIAPRELNPLGMFVEGMPPFMDEIMDYHDPSVGESYPKFPNDSNYEHSWAPQPAAPEETSNSKTPVASGVQTPPQVSSPPQPRRTKVSIPEIVESPQQPPTPTSEKGGSLKRKADALDEEAVLPAPSEPAPLAAEPTPVSAAVTPAPSRPVAERPMKKLRTRLGNAAKFTLGAAVAVALMSQVPDAFFDP